MELAALLDGLAQADVRAVENAVDGRRRSPSSGTLQRPGHVGPLGGARATIAGRDRRGPGRPRRGDCAAAHASAGRRAEGGSRRAREGRGDRVASTDRRGAPAGGSSAQRPRPVRRGRGGARVRVLRRGECRRRGCRCRGGGRRWWTWSARCSRAPTRACDGRSSASWWPRRCRIPPGYARLGISMPGATFAPRTESTSKRSNCPSAC